MHINGRIVSFQHVQKQAPTTAVHVGLIQSQLSHDPHVNLAQFNSSDSRWVSTLVEAAVSYRCTCMSVYVVHSICTIKILDELLPMYVHMYHVVVSQVRKEMAISVRN